MAKRVVIKGASIYTKEGVVRADVALAEGRISAVEPTIEPTEADEVVELNGATLFSGFVDLHVHLREPGFSRKETIATGTAAAARGGVTTLFTMPNLSPVPDTVEHIGQQLDIIKQDAVVNVIPYASITMGQKGAGELVDFEALAPLCGGFSDDGRGVQSDELMEQAMVEAKRVDRPIVAHCEVDALLRKGYIHDGEYARLNGHRGICSESEWAQVERDLKIVERVGCQYHVCHISTKETVDLIRQYKAKGCRVSCETAAHYLILTDMDLKEEGRFKMNPPIRSAEDRAALIEGIVDGTIDVIATDHAPHTAEEKSRGLEKSAFGVVGIEFSFAAMYHNFVRTGIISLDRLVELMSSRARELFGLERVAIEVGSVADLVAIDLTESYKIDPEEFVSMGKATPLEGREVTGRVLATWVGGEGRGASSLLALACLYELSKTE
ncbi:MAG: dihydroorotase [Rikenellaceae bacterium]